MLTNQEYVQNKLGLARTFSALMPKGVDLTVLSSDCACSNVMGQERPKKMQNRTVLSQILVHEKPK